MMKSKPDVLVSAPAARPAGLTIQTVTVRLELPLRDIPHRGPDGGPGVTRRLNQTLTQKRLWGLVRLHEGYRSGGALNSSSTHIDALWKLLDALADAYDEAHAARRSCAEKC